jgi:hypothetical protein
VCLFSCRRTPGRPKAPFVRNPFVRNPFVRNPFVQKRAPSCPSGLLRTQRYRCPGCRGWRPLGRISGSASSPVQPALRFSPSDSDWRTARWARRPVPRRSVPSRHQIQPSESMLWARLLSTSPIHGRICLLKPLCPDEAGGLASWVGHHRSGITGVVAGGTVEPVGRARSVRESHPAQPESRDKTPEREHLREDT